MTNPIFVQPSAIGRWLVPVTITMLIAYTWFGVAFSDTHPLWPQWLGLFSWIAILYCNIKNGRLGITVTLACMVMAVFGLLVFTPWITFWDFRIGSLEIPIGQPIAWLLLIIHGSFNFNAQVDAYLDYQERNKSKQ